MGKFRKKPVVIEAVQWTGENKDEVLGFAVNNAMLFPEGLRVRTLESAFGESLLADPGDWIIKGTKGEFYPCKPDIFATTYDPVEP